MNPANLHRGLNEAPIFMNRFLGNLPRTRILLVCGKNSFQASGAEAWFSQAGLNSFTRFDDFSTNPKEEDLIRGVELFQQIQAEATLAVGGGSSLDMAKAINYFGSTGSNLDDFLEMRIPSSPSLKPLMAIPTTAGTGSEATHFAVLYRGHSKFSVADPSILPSHVWLAPEFTMSMNPYQTACTGMDALAQGIESFWAKGATPASKEYARQAIRLAQQNLLQAVISPTPENRTQMMEAAFLAGAGINISKTTAAHAFSYILTSEFGLPHGHAVALLLPFFAGYHQQAGITLEGVTQDGLCSLLQQIHLARSLPVNASTLTSILLDNVNIERLSNNPVPVTKEMIAAIAQHLAKEPPLA